MFDRLPFADVWVVDFEYHQPDGWLPDPLCVVAHNLKTGEWIERWLDKGSPGPCPYDTGPGSLFTAHAANAECLCHLELDWPEPSYILDTYAESRAALNGRDDGKSGLLVVSQLYGVATIAAADKNYGRSIAMQGRAHAERHRDELISYCRSDVETNGELLLALLPGIYEREHGLAHAIGRGWYMRAIASVERAGIPFDGALLGRLQEHWQEIRLELITALDTGKTDCFTEGVFSRKRFADLLERLGLLATWPKTEVLGTPTTAEDVFKERAALHPVLAPLFELHYTLGRLKKLDLPVGPDGRHRAKTLQAFGTNTGRNAPRGFAFAPAVWVRHLIRPESGRALLYVDYSAQEPHIAAYLSGDVNMIAAVQSGDCYLWFARAVGLVPPNATKASHKAYRDLVLKPFFLSVNYAATAEGVAGRIGRSPDYVEHQLLTPHQRLFKTYWQWSDGAFSASMENAGMMTAMGWPMQVTASTRHRSIRNHRIQAAGADVLRVAITALVANGVRVVAPVHDAVLCECRITQLEETKAEIEQIMHEAAEVVLGHPIPVEFKDIRYPDHYVDGRGVAMYDRVMDLLAGIEAKSLIHGSPIHPSFPRARTRARTFS